MSDTEEERIFEVEIAKNGRAGCKKCKQKCLQGEMRIAKIVTNPFADGKMKNWHHVDCLFEVFKKQRSATKRIETDQDIIGFDVLQSDQQKVIQNKIKDLNSHFGVSPKAPKKVKVKQPQTNREITSGPNEDNLFKTFQRIVSQVALHPSYLDKTGIIRNFFQKGTNGAGFRGDIEIWCKSLLPGSVKRIYNLQSKQLVKIFSRILLEDQEEMLEHLEQGDISETISHFYKNSRKFSDYPRESTISLENVETFLKHLSKLTKEEDQINHFNGILKKLTPDDLKTIIRLIKHDLRMGAGAKHILEGIHADAYTVYQASKDLDGVIERCFGSRKDQTAEIKLLTPVFPMLAEACKSIEQAMKKCPNGMYSEIKYDGERVQVHKHGKEFKYFSRSLKPVLPHKVAHFKDYIPKAFPHANDLILDTEILMMDIKTGKPLPFGTLGVHKKAQFQDATVCLFVFDCIYYNGESLLNKPLMERKKILNENMKEVPNHIVFSEMREIDEPKKLVKMIVKVLKLGLEGLVLKDVMSKYEPGKRHWLKVKKDYLFGGAMADSADLIVLGAWYGTGQKGGMMSVFLMGCYNENTKKFCTVTKVHTGHDDQTLDRLQSELKMVKISGDPDKVPKWLNCTRTMVPDFVAEDPKQQPIWEVTGAEFTRQHDVHTADGISIRFPRVTKIRDDKTWETATNLEELRLLFKNSKENTNVSLLLNQFKKEIDCYEQCASSSSSSNASLSDKVKRESPKKRKTESDENIEMPNKRKHTEINKPIKPVKIVNPLPNIFKGINALFECLANTEAERYFIAYEGTVLKSHNENEEMSYIFHNETTIKDFQKSWPKTARHLHISWITKSVNKMELEPIDHYVVKWETKQ
ncbi:hypothetical protein ABEB36_004211 [Hypothenemus hampei]|uniref:DNA ligase n=1 Tax=Hypothenemus hampei TaxID=57062 RepID=A0ABD1F591_HYPHA